VTEIKQTVKNFFSKHLNIDELGENNNFFEMGLINSLFALQIVNFIEKEFNITITNEDLKLSNFHSINAITHFITKKSELELASQ